MDPEANLKEQRRLIDRMLKLQAAGTPQTDAEALELSFELVGLVQALDIWLSCGGFLPGQWAMGR